MFDFAAAEQADNARQEALWTASRIAIELQEAIQAKDAERLSEAYAQSAQLHAGMTQAEIEARDKGAEKIKAFERLINKHPDLVTDDDIRAAGLDPGSNAGLRRPATEFDCGLLAGPRHNSFEPIGRMAGD